MFFYLVILFTVLPALELVLIIRAGSMIGLGNTLLLLILTGVLGAYLARLQGFMVLRNIQNSLSQGKLPTDEMLDGLIVFMGGLLLLTPGFLTDFLGLFLLFPFTRSLIKWWAVKQMEQSIHTIRRSSQPPRDSRNVEEKRGQDNVEDADFY